MSAEYLIDPADPLPLQRDKLLKIASALMRRVEHGGDSAGAAYTQFQRAVMLEEEVRERTRDLARALELLNDSNAKLSAANRQTEAAQANLTNAIETVQEGFALFDAADRLVMCNSRFGLHLPDIRPQLTPGLRFDAYVTLVSRSAHLALAEEETPQDWVARRLLRHQDRQVVFNVRMTGNRWVQVSEHRTPEGGTVILQTDVSDILRLERLERDRLLDDQARLIRATLDHLDQAVCIFDRRARLVGANQRASELLAIPMGQLRLGQSFDALFGRFRNSVTFAAGFSLRQLESWVQSDQPRAPLSFELTHVNRRTLAAFAQEMPDRGFVFSFSDVSAERAAIEAARKANQQLEQRVIERTLELEDALAEAERANASKSRFVAAASHDLLQPLSAARLYIGSVMADQDGGTSGQLPARDVLGRANNALDSVENILSALLDISKLDSGQTAVHVAPVPLDRILLQLQDELRPSALAKGLDLRVMAPAALVSSDAIYLRRILQNLMANAVRYTRQGRVLVGVRRRKSSLRIEVHDTGPGIPEAQQDLIFREFHRLEATSAAGDGLGLGLAIVERACALLNHPLLIRSTPGKGTMFSVEVPLARPAPARSQPPPSPARSGESLDRMIVLLIENDAELRRALTLNLEQWGVTVLAAAGAAEADALLAEFDLIPDAILADFQLDDGALGTDLLRDLQRRLGAVPSCLITATRQPQLARIAAEANWTLIEKPIAPAPLRHFLQQAFAQHGQPPA